MSTGTRLASLSFEELAEHLHLHPRTHRGGHAYARTGKKDRRVEKSKARLSLLRLFTRTAWPKGLSILTMPGMHWEFERLLLAMRETSTTRRTGNSVRRTFITSIEGDEAIYRVAMKGIPHGAEKAYLALRDNIPAGATCAIRSDLIVRFYRTTFEDYSKVEGPPFHAAWLDFTGPISGKRLECVQRFAHGRVSTYLILTALAARSAIKLRDVLDSFPDWRVQDVKRYRDTSPMYQVVLHRTVPLSSGLVR